MRQFEYLQPTTVRQAVNLLQQYGDRARVAAGNTDLLIRIKRGVDKPACLIGLGRIQGLEGITIDASGTLRLGAMATMRMIERSPIIRQGWMAVAEAASVLGSVQIRNLATIGGNICNASPSADTVPALVALGAQVLLVGPTGSRTVPLYEFFRGPGLTWLRPAELLVEVQVPPLPAHAGCAYARYALRAGPDCALVGVAAYIECSPRSNLCQGARLVLGAVAPTVIRAPRAEAVLADQDPKTDHVLREVAAVAEQEARPISDVRASAEYRRRLVRILTSQAITEAARRIVI